MCAPVISLDFQPHKHKQTLNFDTGRIKRIMKRAAGKKSIRELLIRLRLSEDLLEFYFLASLHR